MSYGPTAPLLRNMSPLGGTITPATLAGLHSYQAFRAEHRGLPQATISRLWREEKARRARAALAAQVPEAQIEGLLEEIMLEVLEQDPKYLLKELLRLSQANPSCFPFGLSPAQLGDVPLLQQALHRIRGGRFLRRPL
jgi:hypothetical protein